MRPKATKGYQIVCKYCTVIRKVTISKFQNIVETYKCGVEESRGKKEIVFVPEKSAAIVIDGEVAKSSVIVFGSHVRPTMYLITYASWQCVRV